MLYQVVINTLSDDNNTINNEYIRMDKDGKITGVTHVTTTAARSSALHDSRCRVNVCRCTGGRSRHPGRGQPSAARCPARNPADENVGEQIRDRL